jgi:magnesium chelatase subunit I
MDQNRIVLQPGILARANNNVLYIDEVNLLENTVIDAILDAAAQGRYTVRRGPLVGTYPSRFVLIGSMNPQEGLLRPQLTDRFGLRVILEPLMDAAQRMDVYTRARAFLEDPQGFRMQYEEQTQRLATMVQEAREMLPHVRLTEETAAQAMELVLRLKIPSNRAEIALLEAARARAASDARTEVIAEDIAVVAPLALRLRQSAFIDNYLQEQKQELRRIQTALHTTGLDGKEPAARKGRRRNLPAPA